LVRIGVAAFSRIARPLSTEFCIQEATVLKAKKLIEGRKPNFFIAKRIAQQTGSKAAYTLNRAFDKQYYLDLVQAASPPWLSMAGWAAKRSTNCSGTSCPTG